MQENPLISFIIPVYDIPQTTLCQCLERILAVQIEGGKEIIVVDDGSQKPVAKQLTPHLRSAIRLIRQDNQGAAAARNVGLDTATGEYIQFVDADDYLLSNAYNRLATFAIKEEADLLTFRSTSSKVYKEHHFPILGPTDGATYMTHHYVRVMPWGYIFRRSVCADLRFTSGSYYEDEEFTPLLFLRCKKMFHTLSEAYFYSEREGSLTRSYNVDFTQKRFPDFERIILHLHLLQTQTFGHEKEALRRRVAQITEDYLYNIMRFTHNYQILQQTMQRLKSKGILPLPTIGYSVKYLLFKWLMMLPLSRRVLTRWVK